MNKSPDAFELDLGRETLLQSSATPPDDEALAADWRLRNDLRRLGGDAHLPFELRRRVVSGHAGRFRAPWLGALAAALLLAVAVPVLRHAPDPTPAEAIGATELAELRLALNTIRDASRQAIDVTGRGVSRGLVVPELGLAELPYAQLLQQTLAPTARRSPPADSDFTRQENQP